MHAVGVRELRVFFATHNLPTGFAIAGNRQVFSRILTAIWLQNFSSLCLGLPQHVVLSSQAYTMGKSLLFQRNFAINDVIGLHISTRQSKGKQTQLHPGRLFYPNEKTGCPGCMGYFAVVHSRQALYQLSYTAGFLCQPTHSLPHTPTHTHKFSPFLLGWKVLTCLQKPFK